MNETDEQDDKPLYRFILTDEDDDPLAMTEDHASMMATVESVSQIVPDGTILRIRSIH